MPHFQPDTIAAALADILSDHFENSQNPHETIQKICSLLGTEPESVTGPGRADSDRQNNRRPARTQLRLVVR